VVILGCDNWISDATEYGNELERLSYALDAREIAGKVQL